MVILKMKIGPKGQVVIPKVLRQKYNLSPGDEVIVEEHAQGVLLEKPFVDILSITREAAQHAKHKGRIDIHSLHNEAMEQRFKKTGLP